MITGKSHHRRPDPLLLLAAAVFLCAVMTTAATAGEPIDFPPGSGVVHGPQLHDKGFTVASVGRGGAGVSVSLTPPCSMAQDSAGEPGAIQEQETLSQVFLYVRYPW
jgi:hypothetical protein